MFQPTPPRAGHPGHADVLLRELIEPAGPVEHDSYVVEKLGMPETKEENISRRGVLPFHFSSHQSNESLEVVFHGIELL